ncbi:hypothetical protein [Octadecabacter antarcticus]|uniref:hypothetical protein n=1 Tax=Octadecabacter antarcticus TaxID=1217908 RepID=UPI001181778E|nr:hypothetical protein [Octadecabacter antarcticus]
MESGRFDVVVCGVCPSQLGFGHFAATECGAGGFLDGEVIAGFDFCEDAVGVYKSTLFKSF